MVLIKVAKKRREEEAKKIREFYSARDIDRSERDDPIKELQRIFWDYCELIAKPRDFSRQLDGGSIPDRISRGRIGTTGGGIELRIIQRYEQPGCRLVYAEVEMAYKPQVAEGDLSAVRDSLVSVGLTKRV